MRRIETSLFAGVTGSVGADRVYDTSAGVSTLRLAPRAGALPQMRQRFSPWLGYAVTLGYAPTPLTYTESVPSVLGTTTAGRSIPADMYEISASYVPTHRMSPNTTLFGDVGAGVLGFSATTVAGWSQNHKNSFRPEGIVGVGLDYHLHAGFGIRGEYRALVTSYPFPNYSDSVHPFTVIGQPTLGVTYTFGKK